MRLWMRGGRNVNLDYFKCGTCSLWNYDLDCGPDQRQYTEVYASPKDASNKFIEHWQASWELSDKAARAVAEDQGIDVIVANFLEYDNPDKETYDVVILRHVLEHLPDSILAMNKIGDLLKDNGLALLEFPNTRSMSYSVKRVLKNRGLRNKKYSEDWRPGHCNEFCRQLFEYLLNKTGFEMVVWQTYSNKPVANAFYRLFPIASKARAGAENSG